LKSLPSAFPSEFGSYFFRPSDILLLRGLVSTAQQKDDGLAGLLEVNAVARAVGHSHLAHALSNRFDIAGIAEPESFNAGNDFRFGSLIREMCQPPVELFGLLHLEHLYLMGYNAAGVNG
jgi:hypothetical protein